MSNNLSGNLATIVPMPGFERLAERIKAHLVDIDRGNPVDITPSWSGRWVNGEPRFEIEDNNIDGRHCVVLMSGPTAGEGLFNLLLLLSHLAAHRAGRITVLFGYGPLTRSDSPNEHTIAIFPELVEYMKCAAHGKLDGLIMVDPHSQKNTDLIKVISVISSVLNMAVQDLTGRKICFVFPDFGAKKRFLKTVRGVYPEAHVVFGDKVRIDSTRLEDMYVLYGNTEEIAGSHCIITDDEVAVGSTIVLAATELLKRGAADCRAVATHGVLCGDAVNIFAQTGCPISRIYIANTVPVENRGEFTRLPEGFVQVFDWEKYAARVIVDRHYNRPIRALT